MANPLYRLQNGLLGTPNNYGGLLADEELQRARNQGLMSFGASLLQAGGPSATPTNLGQALGGAMLQGQQGQQQSTQQALQSLLLKTQLERGKKGELVPVIGEDGKPRYAYAADAVGQSPFSMTSPAKDAASIQEYSLYATQAKAAGKTPIPFDQFLRLRTDQTTQTRGTVKDVAEVPTVVTTQGPGFGNAKPLTNLPTVAANKSTVAGAEAGAKTTATATAENKMALGSTLDDIQKMRTNVDNLLASPGFDTIYGASSVIDPRNYIRGTDASDAQAKRDQLSAEAFSTTIQKMRGLGALSNAEGEKVTAAYTRATKPGISDKEARIAWGEVKGYLDSAEKRAMEKAGVASPSVTTPKTSTETAAQRAKRLGL